MEPTPPYLTFEQNAVQHQREMLSQTLGLALEKNGFLFIVDQAVQRRIYR
ncbi:hypothetical protein AAUPMC_13556 [Pasteurella multocida subsp. multocida str. Anand1_cattle]|nr:hypothetical protein AAUPMC_13556 [Pasteurella multocida subsp. multocida str. Anand1_cattle]